MPDLPDEDERPPVDPNTGEFVRHHEWTEEERIAWGQQHARDRAAAQERELERIEREMREYAEKAEKEGQ